MFYQFQQAAAARRAIYKLHDAQQRFLYKLASKFIKPTVIQKHKTAGLSFANLDISSESQRDDAELGIGITTRTTVMKLLKNGDVEPGATEPRGQWGQLPPLPIQSGGSMGATVCPFC